jgi:hypothetical protein
LNDFRSWKIHSKFCTAKFYALLRNFTRFTAPHGCIGTTIKM